MTEIYILRCLCNAANLFYVLLGINNVLLMVGARSERFFIKVTGIRPWHTLLSISALKFLILSYSKL